MLRRKKALIHEAARSVILAPGHLNGISSQKLLAQLWQSVSMVGYLYVLLRPRIDRHVFEPHAAAAADMPTTVRACFLCGIPPTF